MRPVSRRLPLLVPVLACVLAVGALPSVACGVARGEEHGLTWWTTHALVKVRPDDPAPGASPSPTDRGAALSAARNEFEPFQLVLRADRPVREVDVELTDLVAEGGRGRIDGRHATVYLERYLCLDTPSSMAGAAGEWPDPLVPRVDPYTGQRRNAFPFDLSAGRNQPLWIELYVPPATPPGDYRGELRVRTARGPGPVVPVTLRVRPFTLPSTSSLPTSFGFSGVSVLHQHHGRYTGDDALFALTRLYARAALRHRLSLHGGSMAPPEARYEEGRAELDWARYDREVAPFLDGTVFGADEPLPGARATSVDLRTPPDLPDERRVLYWRAWADHFRERGWLDRLFVYLMDEPEGLAGHREALRLARLAREADPELRTLLTEQRVPALAGAVDVWVTLVNCLDDPPGQEGPCEETVPRGAYRRAAEGGGDGDGPSLWWYQSCVSHGCDEVGGPETEGWPSYAVDAAPVAHRIFPWLAWSHEIAGELYFNTVEAYGAGADPWTDVLRHGGNGDGTLFYPGTPERIGGTTHVPVESLRLKLIREGLEDYEYLVLAERVGAGGAALERARALVPRTYDWDRRPEALYAARRALADALSEAPTDDGTRGGTERGRP